MYTADCNVSLLWGMLPECSLLIYNISNRGRSKAVCCKLVDARTEA